MLWGGMLAIGRATKSAGSRLMYRMLRRFDFPGMSGMVVGAVVGWCGGALHDS